MGADQLGNNAAAINVADKGHGNPCSFGKAHIGNVACAQVHLRR